MNGIHVSAHAVSRYRERVEPVSADEARARLSTPFIEIAASFGATEVILGTGHHAVLQGHTVVTVRPLPRDLRKMRRRFKEIVE